MPPFAADDEPREIARHLAAKSPNWLVLWGVYTHEFVAFPRFDAPRGTIVTAIYPDTLIGRTQEVERRLRISAKKEGGDHVQESRAKPAA
jgi:hypothetical protein